MSSEIITDLLSGHQTDAMKKILAAAREGHDERLLSALRLAVHQPGQGHLYYQKAFNVWTNLGRPALKPNPVHRKVLLLCDATVDALPPFLSVFCASWGVDTDVVLPEFDSVEQIGLGAAPDGMIDAETIVVVLLSEQWLTRYLGGSSIVPRAGIDATKQMLRTIVDGVVAQGPAHVLVGTFGGRAFPVPGGVAAHGDQVGWNLARDEVNAWLSSLVQSNVHLFDAAECAFIAGGCGAMGRLGYFRAKLAYEPAGTVEIARGLATAIADVCGKTHRALVTDWDNTLWGGEVAELGSFGVECSLDTPDGLGYTRVQEYLKSLKPMGILLCGVSRNDPAVRRIFDENPDIPLVLEDFASTQVNFEPKSAAIGTIAQEVGFGSEFMVFLDDSLFELVEAIETHPYLDIVRAGPDPMSTLDRLARSRFFNLTAMSDTDLHRSEAAQSLRRQRESRSQFGSLDEFLQKIEMRLQVTPLNEQNSGRVVQMFQKTNQFNLTTRRHSEEDLNRLLARGGRLGVFSYEDSFGSQGVISAVLLLPEDGHVLIESWIMSCRVLNRTVEEAAFGWMVEQAAGRPLVGEYIPTEKNGLVRDLFKRVGMTRLGQDDTETQRWQYDSGVATTLPRHFIELIEQEEVRA